jgi:signal transduction histidine kinase/DNA-binding response OmpR family regulator/HPt (histidine-containing phosphotransfer) domain-containing protein
MSLFDDHQKTPMAFIESKKGGRIAVESIEVSAEDPVCRLPARGYHSNKTIRLALKLTGICFLWLFAFFALAALKLNTSPWDIYWFSNPSLNSSLPNILMALRIEMIALSFVTVLAIYLILRKESLLSLEADKLFAGTFYVDSERALPVMGNIAMKDNSVGESGVGASNDANTKKKQIPTSTRSGENTTVQRRNGNLESQLRIATDELDRVRRELLDCRDELEQANLAKSDFLVNMSHELLTPMNGIVGMTDLLLGGDLPPREMRFANSIAGSSNALLDIINDLLDFSKIESGTLRLETVRFSLRHCVDDVCSSLAINAHGKNIELLCYVDDNVPETMEGDPYRINQIINNLVANAIAFTDTGEVVVRLSRAEESASLSTYHCEVQDTGVGMSPEMQAQLFVAFTQQDASVNRSHGGIGLGLAITKELVSMMGGEITFKSRLGEGTCFTFTMDLAEVSDEDVVSPRRRTMVGAHVLVVDDNDTNRTILFHQLTNWGLVVETVESGKLALELLRESHDVGQAFDAVVVDLDMPGMDGLELARRIQQYPDFKNIKSLLLTSSSLELGKEEIRKLGINMYVRKPVRQSVLHECLLSLMPNQSGLPLSEIQSQPKPKNARVLLVVDNMVNRNVAMEMLAQLGCKVSLADNGDAAVAMGEVEKYDIVLMDCQMRLMDGYEATRRIKTLGCLNAHTPVVALTANATTGDREKCLSAGMDDYVSKPVLTRTLSYMLDKWVAHPINKLDPNVLDQDPTLLFSGERESDLRTTGVWGEISVDPLPTAAEVKTTTKLTPNQPEVAPTSNIKSTRVISKVSTQFESSINIEAIDAIRAMQRPGKDDLLTKIVSAFSTKTPDLIEQMQGAANDAEMVAAGARGLGISSAYLGAEKMSSLCKRIESVVADSGPDDLAQLVSSLKEEYESVTEQLNTIVKAA